MKLLKLLNENFEEVTLITMLAIMVVLVFLQVVMRYVFESALSWSEEVSRYFFLWIIWLGAAYATKMNAHISIEFIINRLPDNVRKIVVVLKYVIWTAFAIFLAYISWKLTFIIFERGQLSPALRMPMGIGYASIPFGITLMIIRLIQNFYINVKGKGEIVN